jgi:hypothetical protein
MSRQPQTKPASRHWQMPVYDLGAIPSAGPVMITALDGTVRTEAAITGPVDRPGRKPRNPRWQPIKARRDSRCPGCGNDIHVGDPLIHVAAGNRVTGRPAWVCEPCGRRHHDIPPALRYRSSSRRVEAITVPCPTCLAEPGEPCHGVRRPRVSLHQARHHTYSAAREH